MDKTMRDELKYQVEDFKRKFWDYHSLPFANPVLAGFYGNNIERWLENARALRLNFPAETNQFLAYIYKSDYSFKLVWNYTKFHKRRERYSVNEKVDFLNNVFEHGYQHFALLTICEKYSVAYVQQLHKKWFVPDTAREFTNKSEANPWTNSKGEPISGKRWILENCPLHRAGLFPGDIELLYAMKNARSHEKLTVVGNKVFILDADVQRVVTSTELNRLFASMQYAVNLSINFNFLLAIRHNFWFTPALILANPNQFQFPERVSPPFDRLKGAREKVKRQTKKPGNDLVIYRMAIVVFCACEYFFHGLWKKVHADQEAINAFLDVHALELDEPKLQDLYDVALFDSFSLLVETIWKLRGGLGIETPTDVPAELTKDQFPGFDYHVLLHEIMKMLMLVKDSDDKKLKYGAFFELGFTLLLSFVNMAANLGEVLKSSYTAKSTEIVNA